MDLQIGGQQKVQSCKGVIYTTLVTLVLAFIYWPTLRWLVNSWLSSDYYSHGFLVPIVSAVIIWTKREHFQSRQPSLYGIVWLLLGIGLYALSLILEIRYCGVLSLLSVIVALIWLIWGWRTARAMVFPLGYLLFLIPFPFVQGLAYQLQEFSTFTSTHLLEIAGLPVISTGGEIYLEDMVFSVGLSCSGIDSLIALLTLTTAYSYLLKGTLSKRIGLVILAIPIALIANALRIISIITLSYFWNFEAAVGWFHEISSPLFFLLAFLVIILAGWLMKLKINYALFRKLRKSQ